MAEREFDRVWDELRLLRARWHEHANQLLELKLRADLAEKRHKEHTTLSLSLWQLAVATVVGGCAVAGLILGVTH